MEKLREYIRQAHEAVDLQMDNFDRFGGDHTVTDPILTACAIHSNYLCMLYDLMWDREETPEIKITIHTEELETRCGHPDVIPPNRIHKTTANGYLTGIGYDKNTAETNFIVNAARQTGKKVCVGYCNLRLIPGGANESAVGE